MKALPPAILALFLIAWTGPLVASPAADDVVLKAEGFSVTVEDFERYLVEQKVSEEQAQQMLAREGAVKHVFENIYVINAFAEKARNNPAVDKDEVEWMVNNTRQRFLMARQLDLEVAAALENMDWEAAAREEYQANRDRYRTGERVSAAHILISTAERDEKEAETRGGEVLAKLEKGEKFEDLVAEYSDDTGSKVTKGELGFFGRNKMVKEFEDVAFSMTTPGELSGLVKTQFGYHIIRFNEYKPDEHLSFDKVKAQLMSMVKKRAEEQARTDKINAVKTGAVDLGLEVNTELLEQIEQRYQSDASLKSE